MCLVATVKKMEKQQGFTVIQVVFRVMQRIYAPNVFALYPNGFLPEINSDITDFSTCCWFSHKIQ